MWRRLNPLHLEMVVEWVYCHAAQIVVNELVFKLLCSYRQENQA